ncbi:MAG TPA: site-2 protease family protein [Pseudacidobacterium sp.]|jgi:Zn-dependent protease|nr:site-2 protease family protein [Pseudacidobacterium sp.]
MSQQEIVLKIFQFVILLFALSLHEAAHAWMASRLGDPTARMLGRVTLNPMKHIDPLGTVLIPLVMLFLSRGLLFGWAKPTPVTTRNFKHIVRDDILTTVAGPVSNILAAIASLLLLVVIAKVTPSGNMAIKELVMLGMPDQQLMAASPIVAPLIILLYLSILLNLFLAAFNLIPLPPLDGSHIIRHMLPYNALRVYDSLGMISLVLILFFGGPIVSLLVSPALSAFNRVLLAL